MWRSKALDLLAGLPRVALSGSHCLNGEVTTPFGQEPSAEDVDAVWNSLLGQERPSPPWIVLGHRETPSGIVWDILFCPPQGRQENTEVVLPVAAWVAQGLDAPSGPSGWHLRCTRLGDEFWGGVWEGGRCDRIHGPFPDRDQLLQRCMHGIEDASGDSREVLDISCREPAPSELRELASRQPSGDLVGWEASLARSRLRRRHVALARIAGIVAVFLVASGLISLFQLGAWRMRHVQESRLASVKGPLDTLGVLRERTRGLVDSLQSRKEALASNSSADQVLAMVAKAVGPSVKLQVFALEPSSDGYRARLEARFGEWSEVQPFSESLRQGPGVRRVSVASQTRLADEVLAVLELEGRWP